MYFILWLAFGGLAGWIASLITRNNGRMGIILNIVVGLAGAAIGGIIAHFSGLGDMTIFSFWGMGFAILGAVLLLSIINLIFRNRY
ncbi:MAG: GlsB/YeaQ/YmgE family stress response membrane protein [Bacilli bacterium]|nr:GlsB/YeaQ/YmgE family stress response membrane protein [Bacilli bacterium]